jgi:hypothetical protein
VVVEGVGIVGREASYVSRRSISQKSKLSEFWINLNEINFIGGIPKQQASRPTIRSAFMTMPIQFTAKSAMIVIALDRSER